MPPIITLTVNPAVDVSTSTAEVTPEHKLRCGPTRFDPGGGGLNVAQVVRELGGEAIAVYPRGGPTGELLERLLEEKGVRRHPIPIQGLTRESFTVTETGSGREFRFVLPGPPLAEGEWQACLDALEQCGTHSGYIVASGSLAPGIPVDFYARVARVARRLGARLVLDTSGEPLRAALEEGVFLAKPNRREFQGLTGTRTDELTALATAAQAVVWRGSAAVLVVSLGADGALLTSRDVLLHTRTPRVEVQSSVGAGDSFVGAMTLALARGQPLPEAFRLGVAAGTAALLTPGTALCRRADVERLVHDIQPQPLTR